MQVWNVLHAARWKCKTQKIAICTPSHNFVEIYLRNWGIYRQSEKNLSNSNISSTAPQYDEFWPTSGGDQLASLGHPSEFQQVSRLGIVTARHSSSGHQQNFVALNRGATYIWQGGHHVGHWAHILVNNVLKMCWISITYMAKRMLTSCSLKLINWKITKCTQAV